MWIASLLSALAGQEGRGLSMSEGEALVMAFDPCVVWWVKVNPGGRAYLTHTGQGKNVH